MTQSVALGTASLPAQARPSAWSKLPRAARWAIVFGALCLTYFLIIEPLLERMSEWNGRSESWTQALRNYGAQEAELKQAVDTIKLGQRQFGVVDPPGDPRTRPDEFRDAVNEILSRNGVQQRTVSSRGGSLTQGPLVEQFKGVSRIEKQVAEISFLGTPETFAAVLADMERHPKITSVARVTARQSDGKDKVDRLLRVSLVVETWTIVRIEKGGAQP